MVGVKRTFLSQRPPTAFEKFGERVERTEKPDPTNLLKAFSGFLNAGNNLEGGSGADMLTPDSPEVTKEDFKALHRVFPELGRGGGGLSEVEIHNALVIILRNRTKWKDNPFSYQEIRDLATNPGRRMKPLKEVR